MDSTTGEGITYKYQNSPSVDKCVLHPPAETLTQHEVLKELIHGKNFNVLEAI